MENKLLLKWSKEKLLELTDYIDLDTKKVDDKLRLDLDANLIEVFISFMRDLIYDIRITTNQLIEKYKNVALGQMPSYFHRISVFCKISIIITSK